jgi:5,10-methylenetetrahydrofolate reductase
MKHRIIFGLLVITVVVAAFAAGRATALGLPDIAALSGDPPLLRLDYEVLRLDQPLWNVGPRILTVRDAVSEALWTRIEAPEANSEEQELAFELSMAIHPEVNRDFTQFTWEEKAFIDESLQLLWGPLIMSRIAAAYGGE